MSFKISDRCAVLFARLTGGGISSKTTSSLMGSIKKIQNSPEILDKKIPREILCALEKKGKKHKELAIGLQLSMLHVKEAEAHYNSGIKKQQAMLGEQQNSSVSCPDFERFFIENFNSLGSSFQTRLAIAKELYANEIHFHSGNEIRNEVSGKKYALGNKIRALKEIENSSKEKFFVTELKKHSEEYLKMERDINRQKRDISNLKDEAKRCDNLLKVIIYETAKKNKELLSSKQRSLLNDLDKAIANAESAPRIIQKIKENIKLLESKRNEISDYADQLNHLLTLKKSYVAIKETNELLKELHASNTEKSFVVKKTMSEEKNKMDAIATAIATPKSASDSATKVIGLELTDSMVAKALSGLPEVLDDNNDLENKGSDQSKLKPSKWIGAVA